MTDLKDEIKLVVNQLRSHSGEMVEALKTVTEFKNHPETEVLEFEIHDLSSFVLYPMTNEGDQVFSLNGNEEGYFVGHYKIPFDIESVVGDHYYETVVQLNKAEFGDFAKMIIEWFSDCWDAVKCKVTLPVNISLHDSHILFDLSNKRWV